MKMYLSTNNIARIYIVGVSFLNLPQRIFSATYSIIPVRMPSEIEYAIGIIITHVKAGIASE